MRVGEAATGLASAARGASSGELSLELFELLDQFSDILTAGQSGQADHGHFKRGKRLWDPGEIFLFFDQDLEHAAQALRSGPFGQRAQFFEFAFASFHELISTCFAFWNS